MDCRVTNDGVVDVDTSKVVVVEVIRHDEGVCNVGDVKTGVTLASKIGFSAFELESIDEALVEANELLTQLHLVGNVGHTLAETDTDGLLNPQHVGEVGPRVGVGRGGQGTGIP